MHIEESGNNKCKLNSAFVLTHTIKYGRRDRTGNFSGFDRDKYSTSQLADFTKFVKRSVLIMHNVRISIIFSGKQNGN